MLRIEVVFETKNSTIYAAASVLDQRYIMVAASMTYVNYTDENNHAKIYRSSNCGFRISVDKNIAKNITINHAIMLFTILKYENPHGGHKLIALVA